MFQPFITYVFFVYGLAFFCMGLVVLLEGNRAADIRLRHALRPLAVFGLIHGAHEWLEMFQALRMLPGQAAEPLLWEAVRLITLTGSFLSLSAFGASLLSPSEPIRRLSLLAPLVQVAVWGGGVLWFSGQPAFQAQIWTVANVWARYIIAAPAALLASLGLIAQQRAFRQAGLVGFGRDSLWAAVAFAWYGLVGQGFTPTSPLPPSTFLNHDLFQRLFGFPIQLLRAGAAIVAAVFVIRFLRAFEVENQRHIARLQAERLQEAERREAQRGELLRRVVAAQEAERQRIARELHDATGQTLTALGLGLRGAATTLPEGADHSAHKLRQLEGLVAGSLDELRHLIADLRPSHLDDLGLAATLRWYAKDVQTRTPLEILVEVEGEERPLSAVIKLALFRIVQEALTNVIKHSGATQVRIRLSYDVAVARLTVADNGRGFDPAAQARSARAAWGLLGMEERATLLGGRFQLTAQPGRGAIVEVTIPYQTVEALS